MSALRTADQAGALSRTIMVELMEDTLGGVLAHPGRVTASAEGLIQLAKDLEVLTSALEVLARRPPE